VCAEQLVPERAPAFGRIYSYTTTYHPAIPLYEPPYVVAVVEIGHADEPPRIVVRLVDCQPGEVKVGAKVLIETRPLPGGPFSVPVALLDRDGQG